MYIYSRSHPTGQEFLTMLFPAPRGSSPSPTAGAASVPKKKAVRRKAEPSRGDRRAMRRVIAYYRAVMPLVRADRPRDRKFLEAHFGRFASLSERVRSAIDGFARNEHPYEAFCRVCDRKTRHLKNECQVTHRMGYCASCNKQTLRKGSDGSCLNADQHVRSVEQWCWKCRNYRQTRAGQCCTCNVFV